MKLMLLGPFYRKLVKQIKRESAYPKDVSSNSDLSPKISHPIFFLNQCLLGSCTVNFCLNMKYPLNSDRVQALLRDEYIQSGFKNTYEYILLKPLLLI